MSMSCLQTCNLIDQIPSDLSQTLLDCTYIIIFTYKSFCIFYFKIQTRFSHFFYRTNVTVLIRRRKTIRKFRRLHKMSPRVSFTCFRHQSNPTKAIRSSLPGGWCYMCETVYINKLYKSKLVFGDDKLF